MSEGQDTTRPHPLDPRIVLSILNDGIRRHAEEMLAPAHSICSICKPLIDARDEIQARADLLPTATELLGELIGWKRALEKIENLVGEFGTTPAECLAIIGDYVGEALHGIAQGKSPEPLPIDAILHCPKCHLQHVDAPEPGTDWTNPPHKSHKCQRCRTVWRPADVPTNGVAVVRTLGKSDTWARTSAMHPYPPGACPLCKDSNTVAWHSEPIGVVPSEPSEKP